LFRDDWPTKRGDRRSSDIKGKEMIQSENRIRRRGQIRERERDPLIKLFEQLDPREPLDARAVDDGLNG
jgi:hypothetical protein